MKMMSSRERVISAFSHQEPDRTPCFEYVMHPSIARHFTGYPYLEYQEDPDLWLGYATDSGLEKAVGTYVKARLDLAEYFQHDLLYISPNPVPGELDYYDPLSAVGSRFIISHEGSPEERLEERNRTVSTMIASRLPDNCFLVYHKLKEEMLRRGLDLPIMSPAYFHGIWTDVDLMQAMLLAPEVAQDHFRLATQRAMKLIRKYVRLGVDIIGIGGDFAGNRLMISDRCYREFIVPEVRKCADLIRSYDRFSVNATDGNIWPVIEDFLVGCGVDSYLEIDMKAGMDLAELKMRYGDRVTFLGNMDCGTVLTFASPEEVAGLTCKILDDGRGTGGHIFTASNAIMGSVKLENYLAMVNAYRGYFGMASI